MFKTHPIFVSVTAMSLLALAFGLPALSTLPPFVQTAGGLHLALLVFAMLMLRLMAADEAVQTWPAAISVPLAILAAATALGAPTEASAAEIAARAGGIALFVSAGFAGAAVTKRPRGWGDIARRDMVIGGFGLLALVAWNHLYLFPNQAGLALLFDLVGIALFWAYPPLGKGARAGLAPRPAWAHRALDACATCILLSYVLTAQSMLTGHSDAFISAIIAAAVFFATLILGLIEDRAQRPPA